MPVELTNIIVPITLAIQATATKTDALWGDITEIISAAAQCQFTFGNGIYGVNAMCVQNMTISGPGTPGNIVLGNGSLVGLFGNTQSFSCIKVASFVNTSGAQTSGDTTGRVLVGSIESHFSAWMVSSTSSGRHILDAGAGILKYITGTAGWPVGASTAGFQISTDSTIGTVTCSVALFGVHA